MLTLAGNERASSDEASREEPVMDELLTEQQAAARLHVSIKTLQSWRSRGGGPPYRKLGRCVRYAVTDLEAFLRDAVRRSTSDSGPPQQRSATIRTEHLLGKTGRRLDSASQQGTDAESRPMAIPRIRRRVRLHRAYIRRPPETT
jgi:hypothetical protein